MEQTQSSPILSAIKAPEDNTSAGMNASMRYNQSCPSHAQEPHQQTAPTPPSGICFRKITRGPPQNAIPPSFGHVFLPTLYHRNQSDKVTQQPRNKQYPSAPDARLEVLRSKDGTTTTVVKITENFIVVNSTTNDEMDWEFTNVTSSSTKMTRTSKPLGESPPSPCKILYPSTTAILSCKYPCTNTYAECYSIWPARTDRYRRPPSVLAGSNVCDCFFLSLRSTAADRPTHWEGKPGQ